MKIREATFEKDLRELLTGVVEVEETYIGGKPRRQRFCPTTSWDKKSSCCGNGATWMAFKSQKLKA